MLIEDAGFIECFIFKSEDLYYSLRSHLDGINKSDATSPFPPITLSINSRSKT